MGITITTRLSKLTGRTDVAYANKWDRLSELKANESLKQHWGRWVLSKTKPRSLDCIQVMPATRREIEPYWIEISRIGPDGQMDGSSYTWQEHLSHKVWIGEKGLEDFMRAIKEIGEKNPSWLYQGKKPQKKCYICGKPAPYLCDYILEFGKRNPTCNKPMCDEHRIIIGLNSDICHEHGENKNRKEKQMAVKPRRFRAREPIVIEALQLRWETWPEMCEFVGVGTEAGEKTEGCYWGRDGKGRQLSPKGYKRVASDTIGLWISTAGGVYLARGNDWIIKGENGEIYPMKDVIFEENYEEVIG